MADVDEEAERRPTVSLVPSASAAPAAAAVEAILGAVVIPGVPGQREIRYCSSAAAPECKVDQCTVHVLPLIFEIA